MENLIIFPYNLFSLLAYSVAGYLFYFEAKRKQTSLETGLNIIFGALLGALIGSRIGSAFFVYPQHYLEYPFHILLPQVGGKTLVGGILGGYLGVVLTKRIIKYQRSTGDLFAPGLALGIAIGRLGCFVNGCCYGSPTNLPWGIFSHGALRHPTQIYESIFCLGLFAYLWAIRKGVQKEGDLFKIFLLSYCVFRFLIEFIRADVVKGFLSLSLAQNICLGVVIWLGVYFVTRAKIRPA